MEFNEKETKAILKDINRKPQIKPVDPKCLKCSNSQFKDIYNFNEHTKLCYGNQIKLDFSCTVKDCEEPNWFCAEVLHYHLFSKHGLSHRVCDICAAIIKCPWNTIHNLESHKNSVHFQKYRKFPCEKCGKVFTAKESLKFHYEVQHLDIKRYQCETCGYKTNAKNRLENHVKSVHTKEPFYCKYCEFVCHSDKTMRTHVTKIHAPMKKRKIIVN